MLRRKFRGIILIILSLSLVLSACDLRVDSKEVSDFKSKLGRKKDEGISLATVRGPSSIGLIKLVDKYGELGLETGSSFKVYEDLDQLERDFEKGRIDLAALPIEGAIRLYNSTDRVLKVVAINSLESSYILDKNFSIESFEDLDKKKIYSLGEGHEEELMLKSFLKSKNLDQVELVYKERPEEIMEALEREDQALAFLPEPFSSMVLEGDSRINQAFNINKEWAEINQGGLLIEGVLVARKDFLEKHGEVFEEFLETYERSIKYSLTNLEDTARLAEDAELVPRGLGEASIARSNIVYIDGLDMKAYLEDYLIKIYDFDRELLGGTMPGDDFYYIK